MPHRTIDDPTHPFRLASTFRARHTYPSRPSETSWSRSFGHVFGGDLFITFPRDGLGSAWTTSRDTRARSITAQPPLVSSSMWEDMSNSQPSWATVGICPGPDPSVPGLHPSNTTKLAGSRNKARTRFRRTLPRDADGHPPTYQWRPFLKATLLLFRLVVSLVCRCATCSSGCMKRPV